MNIFRKVWCRAYQCGMKVARPFLPYRAPQILNSLDEIPELLKSKKIKNVLLVTDKGIRGAGLTQKLEMTIEGVEGMNVFVFDGVVANPTISCIEDGLTIFKQRECDCIVAFGGGSAMDCAKMIGARSVCPNKSIAKMSGLMKIKKKLPLFIAVPTTAGTGSEATVTAVITDENRHVKFTINDFNLIAHFAVLDPSVTVGLPKNITAWTGLDALTHAVEAYISTSTTEFTRKCSEEAVVAISKNLLKVYANGADIDARREMLIASYKAGLAFTRSYVGYCHAIAHSLGGAYGVAHGLANAIMLPHVLQAYGRTVYKKLGRLAKLIGLCQSETEDGEASTMFINWIKSLNQKMEVPETVSGLVKTDIARLAELADKEANPLYPVPKLMNKNELAEIYTKVLE